MSKKPQFLYYLHCTQKKFRPHGSSNSRPPAFAANVKFARQRSLYSIEQTTPRLILKHLECTSSQRHPAKYYLGIRHSIQKLIGINLISLVKKYFQRVLILTMVLFVLYRETIVVELLRHMLQIQEVVGSNPTKGKICCSKFTLFNEVECEKLT